MSEHPLSSAVQQSLGKKQRTPTDPIVIASVDPALRIDASAAVLGFGVSKLWTDIQAGTLPPPIDLGPNSRGFFASELRTINNARAAGFTDHQMKLVAKRLVAKRRVAASALLREIEHADLA